MAPRLGYEFLLILHCCARAGRESRAQCRSKRRTPTATTSPPSPGVRTRGQDRRHAGSATRASPFMAATSRTAIHGMAWISDGGAHAVTRAQGPDRALRSSPEWKAGGDARNGYDPLERSDGAAAASLPAGKLCCVPKMYTGPTSGKS